MALDGNTLTNVSNDYRFSVDESNGKYTIQNYSTRTYVASRGGYLYSYARRTASYCMWSFEMNGSGVTAENNASKTYPYMGFNASKGYFMVSRTPCADLFFWKLNEGSAAYTTVIG